MTLLDLSADVWTSYVVPLMDLSGIVRLSGCSSESRDLTHQVLRRARSSVVIVAPTDLHSCLAWMKNKNISFEQLVVDRDHHHALSIAVTSQFLDWFERIALKFSKRSSANTNIFTKEALDLLHTKLAELEINELAEVPLGFMDHWLGCQNLCSLTYKRGLAYDQNWLIKIIKASPALSKLCVRQNELFHNEMFAAIAERKDTLTDVTMWVGQNQHSRWNEQHSQQDSSHAQLRRLLESCPSLRKLTFGTTGECEDFGDGLIGMEGKCPHLEELVLHHINFSGDSFADFILACLKLRVCQSDGGFISTHDLERLHRQGGPKLIEIGPHWAVDCSETLTRCPAVVAEVRTYHMHCSAYWETAAAALAFMPHLHTVCLYLAPAVLLPYVSQCCPQLRVLRLLRNEKPRYTAPIGKALIAALSNLPKLEVLEWRITSGLGEAGLMALAQYCPNLCTLDCVCWDVTDAGLTALVRGCPALRTLQVWRCKAEWVTDAFLHAVAQHCPYLKELRLPVWGPRAACFTDPAVDNVIAACTLLKELHIRRRLREGETAQRVVAPAGRLRRLTIDMQIL